MPAYFDVTVRNHLQDSLLSQSAVLAHVVASRGEVEKDAHHEEAVLGAGGFSSLLLWRLWAFGLLLVLKFLGILLSGQQTEVVWVLLRPVVIFSNNCLCVYGGTMPACSCATSVCCQLALCGS